MCNFVRAGLDSKFRKPELSEVIDFLSHENDVVKANAAAYLQHVSYMDDNVKVETRSLLVCIFCWNFKFLFWFVFIIYYQFWIELLHVTVNVLEFITNHG